MNRTQHYQTSFSIRPSSEFTLLQLFERIKSATWHWIKGKECRLTGWQEGPRDFDNFCNVGKLRFPSRAVVETGTCHLLDGDDAWAVSYTELDKQENGRMWKTDIGIRINVERQCVIFSILLGYSISTALSLSGKDVEPELTIPRLVSNILVIPGASYFFNHETFPFFADQGAIAIKTSEAMKKFIDCYQNVNRTITLILFNGSSRDAVAEANILQKKLMAKALVFVADYKYEIFSQLEAIRIHIDFNYCRIFLPGSSTLLQQYDISDPKKFSLIRGRILKSMASTSTTIEHDSICGMQELKGLLGAIRIQQFHDRMSEMLQKVNDTSVRDELQMYVEEVDHLTEANKQLKAEVEEEKSNVYAARCEIDQLKDDNAKKIFALNQKYQGQKLSAKDTLNLPADLPIGVDGMIKWTTLLPHLAFYERAWKPLYDYEKFSNYQLLWKILYHLNYTLYELKYVNKVNNLEKEFHSITGLEYSRSEGTQTKKDADLASLRKFFFGGKEYQMWAHIKSGNKDGKQIRVYFAYDDEQRRIIVGYIGSHMDNATTKRLS